MDEQIYNPNWLLDQDSNKCSESIIKKQNLLEGIVEKFILNTLDFD